MWWFQQGLSLLPVALVVWSAASFLLSYVTATVLHHVDPLVPYISDTGTIPPERCLFGIMLNISTFLGVATMYVRYKQVSALIPENSRMLRLNRIGLALGWVSCFGLCIIANFQKCILYYIHVLGACLTFGVGAIYMLLQTILSFRMQPQFHGKGICWARLAVLLWSACSICSMFVSSVLLSSGLYGPGLVQKLHWDPQERLPEQLLPLLSLSTGIHPPHGQHHLRVVLGLLLPQLLPHLHPGLPGGVPGGRGDAAGPGPVPAGLGAGGAGAALPRERLRELPELRNSSRS
ncbi:DNA damage-regulated autophagy modulator protein 2 isoform X1 [Myiozetetes cayanensis]|uniref:DNA damage-regulated autophagy modulator protein 2 isoform X1 n=1 Tax=Myiozetetes cayanensis TaxID=478635 RepID=UPI0021609027|nr:DNA damage-regulated autophagy modulator protein 2 isoform X1 [Myiozetetes cayanensis]XP_050179127.1 DNA damage-regulated autophagy modulator protein 2 isoform X1 [Myiozetetes cayanensis]XP_050179128.1 DNA damage-regulated autophagy modulator protein 2 isoform X1 [Myiozetetes cayanensis]